jgi:hypothetical protein
VADGRSQNRGTERLLWDCETVGLAIAEQVPAGVRLRDEVGDEFADMVIATLREDAVLAEGDSLPPAAEPGRAA